MINIRQKGADAERAIADDLNYIVNCIYKELGLAVPSKPVVQRNQNQSAVGGKDLVGTFGLAIEVKRQEALSVNTWWSQCAASALELGEIPILLFRQSKQKWRCIMLVDLQLPSESHATMKVRAEIEYDAFKSFFRSWVQRKLAEEPPSENLTHPTVFD